MEEHRNYEIAALATPTKPIHPTDAAVRDGLRNIADGNYGSDFHGITPAEAAGVLLLRWPTFIDGLDSPDLE